MTTMSIGSQREQMIDAIADEIRAATREVVDGRYNTQNMRRAAEVMIDLRQTFVDRNGQIDLAGTSYPYRQAVREIMSRANVEGSERARVMNAIRYHLGNILREKFTPEQLEEFGLDPRSPLARQKADREQRSRVLRVAVAPEEVITDPGEVMAALRSAANLLDNLDARGMGGVDAKTAAVLVKHIQNRVAEVRAELRDR